MEMLVMRVRKVKHVDERYHEMQNGIQVIHIHRLGMELIGYRIKAQIIVLQQVQMIVDIHVVVDIIQRMDELVVY